MSGGIFDQALSTTSWHISIRQDGAEPRRELKIVYAELINESEANAVLVNEYGIKREGMLQIV